MLVIGPGVIVNGVFKPYWGRPRPHSTIPFGGEQEFLPVFQKGCDQDNASFPCGHASMSFYLMAPPVCLLPPAPTGGGIPVFGADRGTHYWHGPDRGGFALRQRCDLVGRLRVFHGLGTIGSLPL